MSLQISELRPLRTISFWAWEKARVCTFSLAEGQCTLNKKLLNRKYSRIQVKGLLFHEMIQALIEKRIDITNYDTFLRELDNFETRYSRHFDFSQEELSSWPEALDIFDSLADYENHANNNSAKDTSYYFEKELRSNELMGKPDLFVMNSQGITLYEFKSGDLKRNEEFKEEYVRQLHYYSYLIKASYGSFPKDLVLRSLRDGAYPVLLDENLSEWIARDAESKFSLYNKSIQNLSVEELNSKLAKPSLEECRYCNLRPVCTKYEVESESFKATENVHVVKGASAIVEGKDKTYLSLDVFEGANRARILNVPSKLVSEIDKFIVIYNLRKLGSGTFSFDRYSKIEFYE